MFVHCKISKVFCINGQLHAFKLLLKLFLIVFQVTHNQMVKVPPHSPPSVFFDLLYVLKCATSPPTMKQNQT